jgi:hypothetical protein
MPKSKTVAVYGTDFYIKRSNIHARSLKTFTGKVYQNIAYTKGVPLNKRIYNLLIFHVLIN